MLSRMLGHLIVSPFPVDCDLAWCSLDQSLLGDILFARFLWKLDNMQSGKSSPEYVLHYETDGLGGFWTKD